MRPTSGGPARARPPAPPGRRAAGTGGSARRRGPGRPPTSRRGTGQGGVGLRLRHLGRARSWCSPAARGRDEASARCASSRRARSRAVVVGGGPGRDAQPVLGAPVGLGGDPVARDDVGDVAREQHRVLLLGHHGARVGRSQQPTERAGTVHAAAGLVLHGDQVANARGRGRRPRACAVRAGPRPAPASGRRPGRRVAGRALSAPAPPTGRRTSAAGRGVMRAWTAAICCAAACAPVCALQASDGSGGAGAADAGEPTPARAARVSAASSAEPARRRWAKITIAPRVNA